MKIEKIDKDIEKLRAKISDLQGQIKAKEQQKTEIENMEIVGMVRTLNVNPADLATFIKAYRESQDGKTTPPLEAVDDTPPSPSPEESTPPISYSYDDTTEIPTADTGVTDSYSSSYGSNTSYTGNSREPKARRFIFGNSDR